MAILRRLRKWHQEQRATDLDIEIEELELRLAYLRDKRAKVPAKGRWNR